MGRQRPQVALDRAQFCLSLLPDREPPPELAEFKRLLSHLSIDERHYWIGTLYTLLLPHKVRRAQAAFFTPPYLAEAVLDLSVEAGFDPISHRALDPAAGGAAFLGTIAARKLKLGLDPSAAANGLDGIEIDVGLAAISRALLSDRLGISIPHDLIKIGDALSGRRRPDYDLVIANPPYGRTTPANVRGNTWKKIAHSGHINKYALFTELSLRVAKPGGVIALVIPSSFRAGPFYDRLREHVRSRAEILAIGTVASRDGIFADVAQDISVLVARKGESHPPASLVQFPTLPAGGGPTTRRAKLPLDAKLPWPTPIAADRHVGGAKLSDYGVVARTGYFVWNREKERLVPNPSRNAFPLLWARNIHTGQLCKPGGKNNDGIDFVTFDGDSAGIVRSPAAVLQRTTNDKQPRRLIAALVSPEVVKKWGGFVTENHTILLTAKSHARLRLVVALLNTKAVDDRYRKVSGTAALSVTLLRELDLPLLHRFKSAFDSTRDAERAARAAYGNSRLGEVTK